MLFIDDDEAQVHGGCEDGGTGAHDNPRFATPDAIPLLGTLIRGEGGVQKSYAAPKRGVKLRRHGGGEADFGDQQNGRTAGAPCVFHRGQIHRSLARTSHSMEQASAKALSIEGGFNMRQHRLLGLIEDILCGRSCGAG